MWEKIIIKYISRNRVLDILNVFLIARKKFKTEIRVILEWKISNVIGAIQNLQAWQNSTGIIPFTKGQRMVRVIEIRKFSFWVSKNDFVLISYREHNFGSSDITQYRCKLCDYQRTTRSAISSHLRTKHKDVVGTNLNWDVLLEKFIKQKHLLDWQNCIVSVRWTMSVRIIHFWLNLNKLLFIGSDLLYYFPYSAYRPYFPYSV